MGKRLILVGAFAYIVLAIFLSIFVVKPPKPIIEIKGEPLLSFGGSGVMEFAVLNTLFSAWFITAVLIILTLLITRRRSMIPSGFYNAFEALIEGIYNFVTGIAGERNGRRFFPLIATLFIFIGFANWMSLTPVFNSIGMYVPLHAEEEAFHEHALVFKDAGINLLPFGAEEISLHAEECAAGPEGDDCRHHLIEEAEHSVASDEKVGVLYPFFRSINTDLMTPLAFALVAVGFIQFWGITTLGFFKYGAKFINFSNPIAFFVGILELIAEFARLISFSFRLFGNMLAGEILLLVMTFLVAVASPILVVFYGLEVFVGAIQAFVFGTLTLVFAMGAVASHDDHGDDHGHGLEEAGHIATTHH